MLMRNSMRGEVWFLPRLTQMLDSLCDAIQITEQERPGIREYLTRLHPTRLYEYPWVLEHCPPTGKVLDTGSNLQWGLALLGIGLDVCLHDLPGSVATLNTVFWGDPNSPTVEKAFKHYERKLCLLAGYLDKLPIQPETFDTVYCLSIVEHVEKQEDVDALMEGMWRVLKPGGRLCLTVDWYAQFGVGDGLSGYVLNHDLGPYFDRWGVRDQIDAEVPWQPGFDRKTFWDGDVVMTEWMSKLCVYGVSVTKPE